MSGTRLGRVALGATAASVGLVVVIAALGPSAAEVGLGHRADDWPLVAHVHPSAWLVTALSLVAIAFAVVAVTTGLTALARGWSPNPRRLLLASFVAVGLLVAVPPIGSADVLDYASYGHAVDRGVDPYAVTPNGQGRDPIASAVESPWRGVTSVYGPVATAEQNLLDELGGDRLRTTVALLMLAHGVAFALTALLLYRVAGTADRRRRAMVLFGLNPVLLYAVVAGGHIDSVLVLGLVAAFAFVRKRPAVAGAVAGLAALVKVSGLLAVGAWVLALWRAPRRAVALAAAAGATVVAGYAVVGLHALNQVRRASKYVSPATPWRAIRSVDVLVGHSAASTIVSALSTLTGVALMIVMQRRLPRDEPGDDNAVALARIAVVITMAWTFTTPYVLAWYDVMPLAFLALLRPSRYDRLMLAHTATLAAVYVPGRAFTAVRVPVSLRDVINVLHTGVAPVVLTVLLVLAFAPDLPTRLKSRRYRGSRTITGISRPAFSS